jgi:c-di-GMP-related signal transduction protein
LRVPISPMVQPILKEHARSRCRMLAEKVETREEFLKAKEMGFVYFQGFYLRHPEILKAKEIPQNRLNYLRLLEMVSREEMVCVNSKKPSSARPACSTGCCAT